MTNRIETATIDQLLHTMNHGYIRSEISAANAEYWRRVETGAHTPPAPVEVIAAQESPEAFTRRKLAELGG